MAQTYVVVARKLRLNLSSQLSGVDYPNMIPLLASQGIAEVKVRAKLRVAFLPQAVIKSRG